MHQGSRCGQGRWSCHRGRVVHRGRGSGQTLYRSRHRCWSLGVDQPTTIRTYGLDLGHLDWCHVEVVGHQDDLGTRLSRPGRQGVVARDWGSDGGLPGSTASCLLGGKVGHLNTLRPMVAVGWIRMRPIDQLLRLLDSEMLLLMSRLELRSWMLMLLRLWLSHHPLLLRLNRLKAWRRRLLMRHLLLRRLRLLRQLLLLLLPSRNRLSLILSACGWPLGSLDCLNLLSNNLR